ncbi:hypothetical protein ACU6U9_11320 [Pseudomonas sp. HK3]|jgi:hypothetical protein
MITESSHESGAFSSTKMKAMVTNDETGLSIYHPKKSDLDKARLKKLTSDYLDGGFHHDKVSISEAHFHEDGGSLVFEVNDFFMPSDAQFHLSSILAEVCVLHAGVIYAHIETGSCVKDREVYLRSSTIKYKRPIRDQRFTLDFTVTKKVTKGAIKSYDAILDFNDGCFTGEYSWIIPLNSETK